MNDFGKEALSSCLFLADYHMARTTAQVSNMIAEVAQGIRDMQAQHEAELAKAAGEWVFCRNNVPALSSRYLIELPNGSLEKVRYDTVDKSWIDSAGLERDPRRWFKPATPPAPPPIKEPEPEIEVEDLQVTISDWDGPDTVADNFQDAHKAAMRPLLERLIDQDKRLDKLLQDYKNLEARISE